MIESLKLLAPALAPGGLVSKQRACFDETAAAAVAGSPVAPAAALTLLLEDFQKW